MKETPGRTGLTLEEPLLWEKSKKGRCGFSLPKRDVAEYAVAEDLAGPGPDFPDLGELDVVRHYTRLSTWNFGVDTGMYPLGSCTMKYNPKLNEELAAGPGLAKAHPLLPQALAQGALKLMADLESHLAAITGMDAVTLQPAAGAHGELTGMLIIHAFQKSKGEIRTKLLVPDTAHGTNPASASLCGYKSIPVPSNEEGILSAEAVEELMDEQTAGIMVTNPNTLGLFEENIKKIAEIVHSKGGQVYCDGANMNAIMGIVHMGNIGVDVLHLNLHKTFSTPHGGGGPGSGPVCVQEHLKPYLPVPRIEKSADQYALQEDLPQTIGKIHGFYGNFGVMLKAYAYILSMGAEFLKKTSQYAVLNANYIKEELKDTLHLAYDRPCMHECVFSDKYQQDYKVSTLDMAKSLIDKGFHPPTIYFPLVVHGSLMCEPTETESKETIDGFIQAFKNVAEQAKTEAEKLQAAPVNTKVKRLDEAGAARNPCLTG